MTETAPLPEANPSVPKPPASYSQRLRRMSFRQLRGEVSQFVPGTRRNRKRTSEPDGLSIVFAAALTAFLDSHESGRTAYIR